MSNYRRLYAKSGIYFFTLVTHQRKSILCKQTAILRLKAAFAYTKKKYPFKMQGLVILPDHLHCIWRLPHEDDNFSIRWNMIKRYFSIGMSSDKNHRREKNIWQRRFWEHRIRNEEDFQRCIDYIHYNPVKHGYVYRPCDWVYSTFKDYVKKGFYEMHWGSGGISNKIKHLDFE